MILRGRFFLLCLLIGAIATPPHAFALFNLNQGKDLIYVSASYSIGWDSNVFSRAGSRGSYNQTASASVDYTRLAGVIGVNAGMSANLGSFFNVEGQDYVDPSFSLSFRKRYGRTTGALGLIARHESQPDPDVGQRTEGWAYTANLSLRYPLNDRFYLSNQSAYTGKFYSNKSAFSDLNSYSTGGYVNYVYSSKLDLNGGYQLRISETSRGTTAYDHAFTLGASGSLTAKLSGNLRMGVQLREGDSRIGGKENFLSFTSGTDVKWLLTRKLSFTGSLDHDFGTTATDIFTDRFTAGLRGSATLTSKFIGSSGVSYGITRFLGRAGGGRRDDLFTFDATLGFSLTTHIRTTLTYLYQINWSTLASADFERQSVTLTATATY